MGYGPGRNLIHARYFTDGELVGYGASIVTFRNEIVTTSPLKYFCTLTAVSSFTRSGVKYVFDKWIFSGIVPEGLVSGSTETTIASEPYEPTGDYLWADAMYKSEGPPGPETYLITTQASPTQGGQTSGDGSYAAGAQCTIVARENTGYRFKDWTSNRGRSASTKIYSFIVNASETWTARFTVSDGLILCDPTSNIILCKSTSNEILCR